MMPGAVGRLSRIGGEWFIWPAYWHGPSFTFDDNALTDELQWTPYRSFRDVLNRVNGTYIARSYPYNVAGNLYDQSGFYDARFRTTSHLRFSRRTSRNMLLTPYICVRVVDACLPLMQGF
jgi:hypothetical protein